jgi:hypothetical protein
LIAVGFNAIERISPALIAVSHSSSEGFHLVERSGFTMAQVPDSAKFLLFGYGPRLHALMALIAQLLGILTLALGIISTVMQAPLGLDGTAWLMLTIILFLWNLSFWLSAYFGAKEGYAR